MESKKVMWKTASLRGPTKSILAACQELDEATRYASVQSTVVAMKALSMSYVVDDHEVSLMFCRRERRSSCNDG